MERQRQFNGVAALAEWMLRRVMAPDAAAAVVGDLLEDLHRHLANRSGWFFPRAWLIGQTFAYALLTATGNPGASHGDRHAADPQAADLRTILNGWLRDGREAWRSLWRRPVFFLTAVATLAVGIGINAAMFSVVNRLLLKPLPYRDAERLVQLSETSANLETMDLSYPDFDAWRAMRGHSNQWQHLTTVDFYGLRPAPSQNVLKEPSCRPRSSTYSAFRQRWADSSRQARNGRVTTRSSCSATPSGRGGLAAIGQFLVDPSS
jgi:hypothetical protein